jgi:hypothetical protein
MAQAEVPLAAIIYLKMKIQCIELNMILILQYYFMYQERKNFQ